MDVQHLSEKVQCRLARMSCKEKVRCWIRRIGHSHKIQYRSDARVDLVHNLLSHIPLTSSRDELFNTPRSTLEVLTPRGLPSTKVPEGEQTSAPVEEMVDVTVLVEDNRSVLTETEVNDSE